MDLKEPQSFRFSMGLVHGFCQKLRFFHRLFLCEMDGEKVFGEVL